MGKDKGTTLKHPSASKIGSLAENYALRYLKAHGLTLWKRNYTAPTGEIDLILRDGETVVFAEIRYRAHESYMTAAETIDARKQSRIILTSQHFLQAHPPAGEQYRYDVILLSGIIKRPKVEWIKQAFSS